jgi:hypothetical protein
LALPLSERIAVRIQSDCRDGIRNRNKIGKIHIVYEDDLKFLHAFVPCIFQCSAVPVFDICEFQRVLSLYFVLVVVSGLSRESCVRYHSMLIRRFLSIFGVIFVCLQI